MMLVLLLEAAPAWACQPSYSVGLLTPGPLPEDALVVVEAWYLDTLVVTDAAGAPVEVEITATEFQGNAPFAAENRYEIRPVGGWNADTRYLVSATWDAWGATWDAAWEIPFVPGASEAVTGTPTLLLQRWDRAWGDSMCAWPEARAATLTLTPASPNPDGLGWLELERADGDRWFFPAPTDGAPFDVELLAEETGEDCFVLRQVDGAGHTTAPSEASCAPTPAVDTSGCSVAPPAGSIGLLVALGACVGRRRTSATGAGAPPLPGRSTRPHRGPLRG